MKGWRRDTNRDASRQPNLPGLFTPTPKTSRRLSSPHDLALGLAHHRLTAAILVFAIAYLIIGGRLAFLTLMNDAPDAPVASSSLGDAVANRADITDRNGVVLATSLPTVSLCADTKKILNMAEAEKSILGVLPDIDKKKLHDAVHGNKHCALIARHLTPKEYYDLNKLGIAGLEFRNDERRLYPTGNIAAHVVGYTDVDDNGLAGMEKGLDKRLVQEIEPVALSLDLRLQNILHREIDTNMREFHAEAATGLVIDITTGEILAMVSLPDFDPQHAGEATDNERFNRATLGVYEMGSTFKIFNTALGLNSGLIHMGDMFDTIHPVSIGNQFIRDFHAEGRWLNVAEIFVHSSNIGSARMAARVGGARQRAFLKQLGLTDHLNLEIPEVGAPLIPLEKNWNESTTLTTAFGHGVAVNSVQLASAVATVVNNGTAVRPTLLKRNIVPAAIENSQVVTPRTSALMRGLMRLVVTEGTAKAANVSGYIVGGKTGTADKIGANHHYMKNARMSSFIGVFPLEKPRYLVFAMLDDPKGNATTHGFATGGWTAAPLVNHVISQMAPMYGISPLSSQEQETEEHRILKMLGAVTVDGHSVE
jgi:cell division protein FtsI (penicillin-binding protein 3)